MSEDYIKYLEQQAAKRMEDALLAHMQAGFQRRYQRLPTKEDKVRRSMITRGQITTWTFYYESRRGWQKFALVELEINKDDKPAQMRLLD